MIILKKCHGKDKGKNPILLLEKKSHGKQKVRTKFLLSKTNKQTNK